MRCFDSKFLTNLLEIHETRAAVFLIMELVGGPDLILLHSLGLLPTESELKIVLKQALMALSSLHKLGIVHRDIKPESIQLIDKG
jgi:serine/threonine protein kinase